MIKNWDELPLTLPCSRDGCEDCLLKPLPPQISAPLTQLRCLDTNICASILSKEKTLRLLCICRVVVMQGGWRLDGWAVLWNVAWHPSFIDVYKAEISWTNSTIICYVLSVRSWYMECMEMIDADIKFQIHHRLKIYLDSGGRGTV